jgi:hypothetical protein
MKVSEDKNIQIHEPGGSGCFYCVLVLGAIVVPVCFLIAFELGIFGAVIIVVFLIITQVLMIKERRDDKKLAEFHNRRCPQCETQLRVRKYAYWLKDGSHLGCVGMYCYSCEEFDESFDNEQA